MSLLPFFTGKTKISSQDLLHLHCAERIQLCCAITVGATATLGCGFTPCSKYRLGFTATTRHRLTADTENSLLKGKHSLISWLLPFHTNHFLLILTLLSDNLPSPVAIFDFNYIGVNPKPVFIDISSTQC